MDKVSVIIPTYNRAHLIKDVIESVLAQTHPVYEVLVCDDASSDNTQDVVQNFSDNRVKWIPGERGGRPAIPRNRGLELAKGDWIAFLDSDDLWHPQKIESQLGEAIREGNKAICTNAIRVIPGLTESMPYFSSYQRQVCFKDLLATNLIICSSAVVHKEVVQRIGRFAEGLKFRGIEDYAYWLKVATYTSWTALETPHLDYLDNPSSSVRADGVGERKQKKIVFDEYIRWSKLDNSDYVELVKKENARVLKMSLKAKVKGMFDSLLG